MVVFILVVILADKKHGSHIIKHLQRHISRRDKKNKDIKDRKSSVDGEFSSWQKASYIFFLT